MERFLDRLLQDARLALRVLRRDRGFTATALLTLGLTVGANAAIFSVVHSVVLSPLPFPDADRVMLLHNSYPNAGAARSSNGVPDYFDRLREVDAFEEQALYRGRSRNLGEGEIPERVRAMAVTPSFFRLLRAPAELGRTFTEEEGLAGAEKKVVLSHGLWQQLFGGDEAVLGRDLRMDGEPYRVVGVMPESFLYLSPAVRLWTPAAFTDEEKSDERRHSNNWEMVGRLRDGAALADAQAQIDALNARNLERFPHFREALENAGFETRVAPLRDELVEDVEAVLYLLWGGAGFVLLIGWVNLANLALVRGSARAKELAVRSALGAARWRLLRQLLTEYALLALAGGAAGLAAGYAGLGALSSLSLEQLPRGAEIAMNPTVAVTTLALALVVGLALGALPALGLLRTDAQAALREEGRSATVSRGGRLLRRALVTVQVALALLLLVGAGLLLASFRQVLALDPGFDPDDVVTAAVVPPPSRYEGAAAARAFYDRALERIRALPGVETAAVTTSVPFDDGFSDSVILAEGYEMAPGESLISPTQIVVGPGYFEALDIPLLSGRVFDQRDTEDSRNAVIVDARLARRFWGDEDPVGRRMFRPDNPENLLDPGPEEDRLTVVGVVGEVRYLGLVASADSVGTYYFPHTQTGRRGMSFVVEGPGDPAQLLTSMRREIAALDPELPLFDGRPMVERMAGSLAGRRAPMLLAAVFAGVALFLAALGLYGVLAYLVACRRREIGIRMALGSTGARIFRLVLHEGLVILGLGLPAGLLLAVLLRRTLEAQLFGVEPLDAAVIGLVAVILGAVSLGACAVPASRATRIDPMVALHDD